MQACRAYYENGWFVPLGFGELPEGTQAIITLLDEPPSQIRVEGQDHALVERLVAIDEFIAAVKASDEEVPEFERVKFNREVVL